MEVSQFSEIEDEFVQRVHSVVWSNVATFGLLKLTPWRIALINFPAESYDTGIKIWRSH